MAVIFAATSCRDSAPASGAGVTAGATTYATTTYSFRAILEPIVGSTGVVRHLLPSGASPHTYEPRPSDMRTTSNAGALFYGAPELDGWAARLGTSPTVALIGLLPDSLLLELPESGHGDDGHHHSAGRDPHFWMDPLRVDALLPALVDTLCAFDSAACAGYRSNADAFSVRLRTLHDTLRTLMAPVRDRSVLLSHPFIQYFTDRYGIRTAGVIEEMPGSEPTSRDMQRIVEAVRRSGADAIVTLPQLPDRAARAVSETVGVPVLELDPIGGAQNRPTYETLILNNARKLRRGLSQSGS